MKIVCDGCQAKYFVADDKVEKRAFKMTCQKCGHSITVRQGKEKAEGGAAALRERLGLAGKATNQASSEGAPASWYYSKDGQSYGPFTLDDLKARFESSEIGSECYVWNRSLGEWKPAHSTPPFDALIAAKKPAAPPPLPSILSSAKAQEKEQASKPSPKLAGLRQRLAAADQAESSNSEEEGALVLEDEEPDEATLISLASDFESQTSEEESNLVEDATFIELNDDSESGFDDEDMGIDLDVDGASRVVDMKALAKMAGASWEPEHVEEEAPAALAAPASEDERLQEQEDKRSELFKAIEAARESLPAEAPVERSMLIHIDHLKQQNRRVRWYAFGAVAALALLGVVIWVVISLTQTDLEAEETRKTSSLNSVTGEEIDDAEFEGIAPLAEFTMVEPGSAAEDEEDEEEARPKKTKSTKRKKKDSPVDVNELIAQVDASAELEGQTIHKSSSTGLTLNSGEIAELKGSDSSLVGNPLGTKVGVRKRKAVQLEAEGVGQTLESKGSKYAGDSTRSVKASERNRFLGGLKRVSKSVQECQKRQMKSGDSIAAKVYLTLTVEPSGKVSKLRMSKSVRGTTFAKCLLSKQDRWNFEAFEGKAVELRQGFVLE